MTLTGNVIYLGVESNAGADGKIRNVAGFLQGLESKKVYIDTITADMLSKISPMAPLVVDFSIREYNGKTYFDVVGFRTTTDKVVKASEKGPAA